MGCESRGCQHAGSDRNENAQVWWEDAVGQDQERRTQEMDRYGPNRGISEGKATEVVWTRTKKGKYTFLRGRYRNCRRWKTKKKTITDMDRSFKRQY